MDKTLTEEKLRDITSYIFVEPDLCPCDLGFVFGTFRSRYPIAEHSARLFHRGCFDKILVTGGVSSISKGRSESYWIKRILLNRGVPKEAIFTENKSKNGRTVGSMFGTYWNIKHALPVLERLEQSAKVKTITAIAHAFHSRRALMTLNCLLPSKEIRVVSFNIFDIEAERWHEEPRFRQLVLRELEIIEEFFEDGELREQEPTA
jgi:uncharacterized SAM-binding protein YcdF (DUF218 family)